MTLERGSARLIRAGTVRDARSGCTSIEVSVPCTTCRLGCHGARGVRHLELTNGRTAADLQPGERVRISIAAAGLAKSSVLLFGPVLVWAVWAAWLPVDASPSRIAGGGAGFLLCLLLGRALVRADRRAGRLLDVRAERDVISS